MNTNFKIFRPKYEVKRLLWILQPMEKFPDKLELYRKVLKKHSLKQQVFAKIKDIYQLFLSISGNLFFVTPHASIPPPQATCKRDLRPLT